MTSLFSKIPAQILVPFDDWWTFTPVTEKQIFDITLMSTIFIDRNWLDNIQVFRELLTYKCFVYFRETSFETLLWKKNKHRNIVEVYEEYISALLFSFLVFICCITLLTENCATIDNGLSYSSDMLYLLLKKRVGRK